MVLGVGAIQTWPVIQRQIAEEVRHKNTKISHVYALADAIFNSEEEGDLDFSEADNNDLAERLQRKKLKNSSGDTDEDKDPFESMTDDSESDETTSGIFCFMMSDARK